MKILFLLLYGGFVTNVHAQINFRNISFAEALRLAKKENKWIFLQLEAEDCDECNYVAEKGLSDKDVIRKVEEGFIPIKINAKHSDRSDIASQYNMQTGFGTLFFDWNGALLHKYPKTTSRSKDYLEQLDIALYSTSESARINDLEKEYTYGNREIGFLETLLSKRKTLYLQTDVLLDEYVSLIPADSLNSIRTLIFIAQMAPMLDSKASVALRKDQQLFNKAWYSMSLPLRININNSIIYKGIRKAIKEKNVAEANMVASFAATTNISDRAAGAKAYQTNMLAFYEKTDTINYLKHAIDYYNHYFMTVTKDSVNKIDSGTRSRLMPQSEKKDTVINDKRVVMARMTFAPSGQFFKNALNRGAWNFYKMTNDSKLLSIATEWAKRGLELFKTPDVLDTYARLLYKQNQKQAAIESESEAVTLSKEYKLSAREYETVLEKMKKGVVLD